MSVQDGVAIGMACVHRCQHDHAREFLTLPECVDRVAHPTATATRAQLVEAIAYLSAQVVGYQRSQDRDAALAVNQIETVLRRYREQHRPEETQP